MWMTFRKKQKTASWFSTPMTLSTFKLATLIICHNQFTTQNKVRKIKHYCNRNGLLLSSMKTPCIFFDSIALIKKKKKKKKTDNTTISAGEASIHPSKSVKNLRLHFGNYMSFDVHVTEMCKKVSGTLMHINCTKDLSKEVRLIDVETQALSHINYGITIWSTANLAQLNW